MAKFLHATSVWGDIYLRAKFELPISINLRDMSCPILLYSNGTDKDKLV